MLLPLKEVLDSDIYDLLSLFQSFPLLVKDNAGRSWNYICRKTMVVAGAQHLKELLLDHGSGEEERGRRLHGQGKLDSYADKGSKL